MATVSGTCVMGVSDLRRSAHPLQLMRMCRTGHGMIDLAASPVYTSYINDLWTRSPVEYQYLLQIETQRLLKLSTTHSTSCIMYDKPNSPIKSPAVAEVADRTAYEAVINDHLDDKLSQSHVRSNINRMVTWTRKRDIINK